MEAKDTVMSDEEINYIRNSTVARDIAENAMNEGYRTGIKEVVEWIMQNTQLLFSDRQKELYWFVREEWQAKLKEWE